MERTETQTSLSKQTIKIFWQHTKPYWPYAVYALGASWLAAGVEVYRPWLYRSLLNIFSGSTEQYHTAVLIVLGLLGLGIVSLSLRRTSDWAEMYYQSSAKRDLWITSFKELHRQRFSFVADHFTGALVKRANRYDSSFEQLADQLSSGLGQTIIRVGATLIAIFLFRIDFGLIFISWVALYSVVAILLVRWKRPLDLEKASVDSKVSGWLADSVSNFSTIKTFGSYRREVALFTQKADWFLEVLRKQWRATFRINSTQALLVTVLEVVIFLFALQLWKNGRFTVGDMALIQLYVGQINGRLWDLGRQVKGITQSLADANEMTEIILQPDGVADDPQAKELLVTQGRIIFSKTSFAYRNDHVVLRNFSLTIAPGEKLALVGPSGGGKTTITKLLLRLYDVTKGDIIIDEQNIAQVTQESLRRAIAYVPQEPLLFHRSLMDNIRYGKPEATDAEVVHAAKLAHAHEFIKKSEEGYDTLVGERGIKLSGGERQRIAIARAMLKDAPILVMDEATSSLDSESEALIQDALKVLMEKKTVIVIAHRLSTIMQMDRIVVISGGKIVEQGRHGELIKATQGVYQKLWDIQAGSFN